MQTSFPNIALFIRGLWQKLLKSSIWIIMAVAFLIRLPFMIQEGVSYDWWVYATDGSNTLKGKEPYVDWEIYRENNIPPGYIIVVTFFYWLAKLFHFSVYSIPYNLIMKSWMVIGDIACVYLVYHLCLALNLDVVKAKAASLFIAFNPYILIESSYQGHFDSLVAATILAAALLAIRGRSFISGVTISVGVLIKMIPILGLVLVFKFKRSLDKIKFLFGFLLPSLIIYGVFIYWIGTSFITGPIEYHGSRTDYLTESNKTATYFFFLYATNTFDSYAIYVQDIWLLFAIPVLLYFAFKYSRMNHSEEVFKAMLFLLAGLIATMKYINPQYLVWVLPFMTIYMVMYPEERKWYAYWFLALWFTFWALTLIKWWKILTGLVFLPALICFFYTNLKGFWLKLKERIYVYFAKGRKKLQEQEV